MRAARPRRRASRGDTPSSGRTVRWDPPHGQDTAASSGQSRPSAPAGARRSSSARREYTIQMSNLRPRIVVLTGPTGVGKTDLAVRLVERFGGEIVSVD